MCLNSFICNYNETTTTVGFYFTFCGAPFFVFHYKMRCAHFEWFYTLILIIYLFITLEKFSMFTFGMGFYAKKKKKKIISVMLRLEVKHFVCLNFKKVLEAVWQAIENFVEVLVSLQECQGRSKNIFDWVQDWKALENRNWKNFFLPNPQTPFFSQSKALKSL